MERLEKISVIIEFLDDNHIKVIDTTNIGAIIVDAEHNLNREDDECEYNELLDNGLTEEDIESFKKFLEENTLMMIKIDEISGVSFENCEYYIEGLDETNLWGEEEKEEKEEDDN
jgi:hypothetical protein